MKYVLLFVGTMEDQKRFENLPPEQLAAGMKAAEQWFEEYSRSGKIVGGEQLKGPETATTVRFSEGRAIVTDGPFIESKEIIAGSPSCRSKIWTRRSRWPRPGPPVR